MPPVRNIFLYIILAWGIPAICQDTEHVRVSADKARILLGEPFTLQVSLRAGLDVKKDLSLLDSIPYFERVGEPSIDSATRNGYFSFEGRYRLVSFDSGHHVIPALVFSKKLRSDTIGIDVVFSEFDPETGYHDIKDIIEVKNRTKKRWGWFAAGGALLAALLLWYLYRKKRPIPAAPPARDVDPYREAIGQLEQLLRANPGVKPFHTQLAAVFRLYVYRKKGILSLQKTTDDLVIQLKGHGLLPGGFEKLCQALLMGDLVKFAQYQPGEEENRIAFETIRDSITEMEKGEGGLSPDVDKP
ncbi:MAG: hypothetical protein ACO25B_08205 [Chitinophagaceae bacterium]